MDEILKQEMQKELTTRILPYWMERMVDRGERWILRTHHRTGGINAPGR